MHHAIHNADITPNALQTAANSLRQIIVQRMQTYFGQQHFNIDKWINETFKGGLLTPGLANKIPQIKTADEWIVVMLAIIPHIQPNFFESIISEHLPNGGDFTEFGGVKGANHRGVLPTGETAQFVIGGNDLDRRLQVQQLFEEQHFFYRNDIAWLEAVKEGEPLMSGRIILSPRVGELFNNRYRYKAPV